MRDLPFTIETLRPNIAVSSLSKQYSFKNVCVYVYIYIYFSQLKSHLFRDGLT